MPGCPVDQRSCDCRAGRIGDMQYTAVAMPALPGQMGCVALPVEVEPEAHDMVDRPRCLRHGHAHRRFDTKPGASGHGICDVILDAVVRCGHRGNTALGAVGRAATNGVLRQHGHLDVIGEVQGRRQAPRHRCR